MMNALWLVGMLFANGWGMSVPAANTEKALMGIPLGASNRIVACWDNRVHVGDDAVNPRTKLSVLKGSVYLYCGQTNKTIQAKGTILVEACNCQGRRLAEWTFDAASLNRLKRTDLIGVGYTLCLPLDRQYLAEKDLKVTLTYRSDDGKSCCAEPTRLTLRSGVSPIVQAGYTEMSNVPTPKASKQMSLTDIVTLSKRGISDDIIIRQIELTQSMYDLTTEQILSLREQGVTNAVIRAMQERRTNTSGAVSCTPRVPSPAYMTR